MKTPWVKPPVARPVREAPHPQEGNPRVVAQPVAVLEAAPHRVVALPAREPMGFQAFPAVVETGKAQGVAEP